jgi:hypothetical protein
MIVFGLNAQRASRQIANQFQVGGVSGCKGENHSMNWHAWVHLPEPSSFHNVINDATASFRQDYIRVVFLKT